MVLAKYKWQKPLWADTAREGLKRQKPSQGKMWVWGEEGIPGGRPGSSKGVGGCAERRDPVLSEEGVGGEGMFSRGSQTWLIEVWPY